MLIFASQPFGYNLLGNLKNQKYLMESRENKK